MGFQTKDAPCNVLQSSYSHISLYAYKFQGACVAHFPNMDQDSTQTKICRLHTHCDFELVLDVTIQGDE